MLKRITMTVVGLLAPVSAANAAYQFDFHYDAYGTYAPADIVFTAKTIDPPTSLMPAEA